MVDPQPDAETQSGAIAQLGERVLCKHEVVGSIPSGSTILVSSRFGSLLFEVVSRDSPGTSVAGPDGTLWVPLLFVIVNRFF